MNLIAHRGIWNKYIKDNSYEAIKNAIKSDKYIGVEFDVRTTQDKKIIIYHDALYNGTLVSKIFYKDMKDVYSISSLLDKIDNKILEEKYPETDEMNDELKQQAESYYSAYKQYYKMDKETFLSNNGFGSEKAFLEYLRLRYRRNTYAKDYIKTLISDKEVEKYYNENSMFALKNKSFHLAELGNDAGIYGAVRMVLFK